MLLRSSELVIICIHLLYIILQMCAFLLVTCWIPFQPTNKYILKWVPWSRLMRHIAQPTECWCAVKQLTNSCVRTHTHARIHHISFPLLVNILISQPKALILCLTHIHLRIFSNWNRVDRSSILNRVLLWNFLAYCPQRYNVHLMTWD